MNGPGQGPDEEAPRLRPSLDECTPIDRRPGDQPESRHRLHPRSPLPLRDRVIDLKLPADRVYDPPTLLLPLLREQAPWMCPCDVMMRRQAIAEVGGFDYPNNGVGHVCEDTAVFSKMMLRYPVFVLRTKPHRVIAEIRAALQAAGWSP